MKTLIQQLSILAIFLFSISCEKQEIPEPEAPPVNQEGPSLFISGKFNGSEQTKVIDGDKYFATSYATISECQCQMGDFFIEWGFYVFNNNSDSIPEFSVSLTQHTTDNDIDYSDLIEITDSSHLKFTYGPSPLSHGNTAISYFIDNQYYLSYFMPNAPLTLTKKTDTIIDNKEYRILGLEGNILLESPISFETYEITDFKAQIAFSI